MIASAGVNPILAGRRPQRNPVSWTFHTVCERFEQGLARLPASQRDLRFLDKQFTWLARIFFAIQKVPRARRMLNSYHTEISQI